MSYFQSIKLLPEDPILGIAQAFAKDNRKTKVNLGIGAYKNEEGKSYVLSSVRKAEELLHKQQLNKDYIPILGSLRYIEGSLKLIFSNLCEQLSIAAAQTIGGTGALRTGGDFLKSNHLCEKIYISNPSWANHAGVFKWAGLKTDTYPYYDFETNRLDFSGLCGAIKKMPAGSAILFQPCCHNPTGIDPTFEQWQVIADLVHKQRIIPFFDLAYLGFDKSTSEDASVIRYFTETGHELLVALSYSKNFGLYGERAGLLAIVSNDPEKTAANSSQIKQIIRANYSSPPLQAERIVTAILENEDLHNEWLQELEEMRIRIRKTRQALLKGLRENGGEDRFDFFEQQTGMFSYTGLNEAQVSRLQQEYGLYMTSNGRINVAGLNDQNFEYVISAITSVI